MLRVLLLILHSGTTLGSAQGTTGNACDRTQIGCLYGTCKQIFTMKAKAAAKVFSGKGIKKGGGGQLHFFALLNKT